MILLNAFTGCSKAAVRTTDAEKAAAAQEAETPFYQCFQRNGGDTEQTEKQEPLDTVQFLGYDGKTDISETHIKLADYNGSDGTYVINTYQVDLLKLEDNVLTVGINLATQGEEDRREIKLALDEDIHIGNCYTDYTGEPYIYEEMNVLITEDRERYLQAQATDSPTTLVFIVEGGKVVSFYSMRS